MSGPSSPSLFSDIEKRCKDANRPLEQRLVDTCTWFYQNKDSIPKDNLGKRCEFMEKYIEISIELMASMVERLQMSENRQKSDRLWLPSGLNMSGDVKRFG